MPEEGSRHQSNPPLVRPGFIAKWLLVAMVVGSVLMFAPWFSKGGKGEFDLSQHSVPLEKIVAGGPGKDGIPAIREPQFVSASEASFLQEKDRVLGIRKGDQVKAYPIKILNWHEVVNDTVGQFPVIISYCPLCGTGMAFRAIVGGEKASFGVSGLLYQSDLLMYDHQSKSLWSQISMEAIAGPLTGARLVPIPLDHTTWHDWKSRYPATLVLSPHTGFSRDYSRDPYGSYDQTRDLLFDIDHFDPSYHPKEWIVGIDVQGTFKAFAFSELEKTNGLVKDRLNGQTRYIHFNREARTAFVLDEHGQPVPSVMAYWFAWYTFHPTTQVFHAEEERTEEQGEGEPRNLRKELS